MSRVNRVPAAHISRLLKPNRFTQNGLFGRYRYEPAREVARALVGTPAYGRSRRARYKVEALFAELKQRMRVQRVRLRRLWNVLEQFLLAATAQNLKRLVRFLAQQQAVPAPSTA